MFVGRKHELAQLEKLYRRDGFQMAVVYGRRRVGKTTLINEFARNKRTLSFTALDQSDTNNLADFTRVVSTFFGLPSSLGGVWLMGRRLFLHCQPGHAGAPCLHI